MEQTVTIPSHYPKFYPEILYSFVALIVPTNAIIIVAFFSNHRLRCSQANKYVCVYAVVDFLVGAVFIPCLLADVGQLLSGGMIMYSLLVSLLILMASTIDRYVAICKPLRYETIQTEKVVGRVVLFCWLFPLFVVVLPQIWLRSNDAKSFLSLSHRIYLGVVVFGIVSILLLSIAAYIRIYMVGIKHLRDQLILREFEHWTRRVSKEIKFARMFFMLSLTFLVFWVPTGYMTLVDNVFLISAPPIWIQELNFYWIFMSSFLNPLIYGVFHKGFRRTIVFFFRYGRNPSIMIHPMLVQSIRTTRARLSTEGESL